MGYQSKTYSLHDDVVAAIELAKAGGETPSRYLARLIALYDAHDGNGCYVVEPSVTVLKTIQTPKGLVSRATNKPPLKPKERK